MDQLDWTIWIRQWGKPQLKELDPQRTYKRTPKNPKCIQNQIIPEKNKEIENQKNPNRIEKFINMIEKVFSEKKSSALFGNNTGRLSHP